MKTFNRYTTIIIILGFICTCTYGQSNDGKALFEKYSCQGCHTINKGRLVGPDLANIGDKRSETWLKEFIRSPQTMIQNGDSIAVSLYEEYNNVVMPANNLTSSEMEAILQYIKKESPENVSEKPDQKRQKQASTFTANNFTTGENLFTGQLRFFNKGPSCVTCHHISTQNRFAGGNLAVDLAGSFKKLNESGVKAVLRNPAFPVMKAAYKNKPLLDAEIHNLTAFLKKSSETEQAANTASFSISTKLIVLGLVGTALLLILISLIWRKRKKQGVHDKIFNRQLKTI